MTTEQEILLATAKTKMVPDTITSFSYIGVIAASEFLTYNVKKLYVALELTILDRGDSASPAFIQLFDETNAISGYLGDNSSYWNNTIVRYHLNSCNFNNLYFSRLVGTIYAFIKITGFKLTHV